MSRRPDLLLKMVCPVCDPEASSSERTAHFARGGDLWCVNTIAHLELLGTTDDQLLLSDSQARVFRTDGDSERYHVVERCGWLRAGQRSRAYPAPVFETNRLEALRSGRTACHGCCPQKWDSEALDRAAAAAKDW